LPDSITRAGRDACAWTGAAGSADGAARAAAHGFLQHVDVQDEFPHVLLELADLLVLEPLLVPRPAAQAVLGPGEEPLPPLLHLGDRQPVLVGRLRGGGLPAQQTQHQRRHGGEGRDQGNLYLVPRLLVRDEVRPRHVPPHPLVRADLPHPVRFYDLRHSVATLMLAHGVDVPTVAATLGHARTSTTLDVYAHAPPDRLGADVAALGRAIRRAA
jgi:hypothetical protein